MLLPSRAGARLRVLRHADHCPKQHGAPRAQVFWRGVFDFVMAQPELRAAVAYGVDALAGKVQRRESAVGVSGPEVYVRQLLSLTLNKKPRTNAGARSYKRTLIRAKDLHAICASLARGIDNQITFDPEADHADDERMI